MEATVVRPSQPGLGRRGSVSANYNSGYLYAPQEILTHMPHVLTGFLSGQAYQQPIESSTAFPQQVRKMHVQQTGYELAAGCTSSALEAKVSVNVSTFTWRVVAAEPVGQAVFDFVKGASEWAIGGMMIRESTRNIWAQQPVVSAGEEERGTQACSCDPIAEALGSSLDNAVKAQAAKLIGEGLS